MVLEVRLAVEPDVIIWLSVWNSLTSKLFLYLFYEPLVYWAFLGEGEVDGFVWRNLNGKGSDFEFSSSSWVIMGLRFFRCEGVFDCNLEVEVCEGGR